MTRDDLPRVYAVTTLRLTDRRSVFPFDGRTVGLFTNIDDAERAVLGNFGDIYECGYYPWACVEAVGLDCLYPPITERRWYQWVGTEERGSYVSFDGLAVTSRVRMNIANWSMIG